MKKSYEEICELLEQKMAAIENDDTPLFELVDAYKDGMNLIKEARDLLENAKKEIKLLDENFNKYDDLANIDFSKGMEF